MQRFMQIPAQQCSNSYNVHRICGVCHSKRCACISNSKRDYVNSQVCE